MVINCVVLPCLTWFCSQYHNDTSLKNPQWALATGVFSPRDISRIEREFLDVLDYQLRVTEADLLTLERPFISSFFSLKSRVAYTSSSSSSPDHLQQDDDEDGEGDGDGSSRWSDSDEDDDATTDFTSSPSESDRSISPKTPSTGLDSFPLPPASDTASSLTKIAAPQPARHLAYSPISLPLSV